MSKREKIPRPVAGLDGVYSLKRLVGYKARKPGGRRAESRKNTVVSFSQAVFYDTKILNLERIRLYFRFLDRINWIFRMFLS